MIPLPKRATEDKHPSPTEEILLFKSYSDQEDLNAIKKVLERGTYWAIGPEIEEFEQKLATFFGTKHALAFSSGTTALHSCLITLGITSGEVIVPSFTFPATVNSVIAAGAKPVFADIEPETLGLSVDDVARKITPNTKAILPMHFSGHISRDITKLRALADQNNIPLIEDNAHSIGATLNSKMAGTFGHAAMTSFCFNKIITTGEGGVLITNSDDLANKLKLLRSHGRAGSDYVSCGLNFRIPTLNAALGISQISKIHFLIESRREIARYYNNQLRGIPDLIIPEQKEGEYCVYLLYNLILKDEKIRSQFLEHLKNHKIPYRVTYNPVHLFSYYRKQYGTKEGDLPITEDIARRIITIPLHLGLTKKQQEYIATTIKQFFRK